MNDKTPEFDAIIVGSGPGGATVARELSRRGQQVLLLERGGNQPLKNGVLPIASMMNAVSVGDKLASGRALTTGGTTAVYLGATVRPRVELFQSLGIDISREVEEAEKELPLAPLPDALLRPQSIKLRETATALGYELFTSRMLVDQSKCSVGYTYGARWTARAYVQDAVNSGATLVNQARALRVLVEDGRAVGVEYEQRKGRKAVEIRQARASTVVLAAGGPASPVILRRSGLKNAADSGFYCHPSIAVYGTSPLKGQEGFGGSWGLRLNDEIRIGDANFDRTFYRLIMLGQRQWRRVFSYTKSIGMGVMVKDSVGGELGEDLLYRKPLTEEDRDKLAQGEQVARRVLEHAGAKNLFTSAVSSSHIGGAIKIGRHVDAKLQTQYRNLHVCDGSVLPPEVNTPTLTLICLGKYLANQIAPAV
ncbi:MAG: GMC family oxidoreductase [Acidobacteria bacterium]|nr:GMC family oxidoreductase [Acidobacteriota bacterium]